jgi:hypothetical protein
MSEMKNVLIKSIGEIQEFGAKGFKVVKFIVVDDSSSEYEQILELQCTQDKADNLVKFNKAGDRVDISYNLRGREWTNPQGEVKVFNSIEAWKVFKADTSEDVPAYEEVSSGDLKEAADDLPF